MRAAIVLAAGSSRRFGAANKLLVRWRYRPLLHHALTVACAAPVGRVLVVVGRDPRVSRCARAFASPRIEVVGPVDTESRRDSLAAALRRLRKHETEALVFLGDMPLLDRHAASRLLRLADASYEAARPAWRGRPGHPVLLRDVGRALARLEKGVRPFDPATTAAVPGSRTAVLDIDRPGAFQQPGFSR